MCHLHKLPNYDSLRQDEKEIVGLLLQGRSNADICNELCLGEKNLERKLGLIYTQLGIEKTAKEKKVVLLAKVLALV